MLALVPAVLALSIFLTVVLVTGGGQDRFVSGAEEKAQITTLFFSSLENQIAANASVLNVTNSPGPSGVRDVSAFFDVPPPFNRDFEFSVFRTSTLVGDTASTAFLVVTIPLEIIQRSSPNDPGTSGSIQETVVTNIAPNEAERIRRDISKRFAERLVADGYAQHDGAQVIIGDLSFNHMTNRVQNGAMTFVLEL